MMSFEGSQTAGATAIVAKLAVRTRMSIFFVCVNCL